MKYKVTLFKSLSVALKELSHFILDGLHLQSGKPLPQLDGMRHREAVANWLLCAALNDLLQREVLSFTTDTDGAADGLIYNRETATAMRVEHIYIPSPRVGAPPNKVEEQILKAVKKKNDRGGAAYATGKTLIVFSDTVGQWFPNRVVKQLPSPLHFDAAWVIALQGIENGEYTYNVAKLDLSEGNAPVWRVTIVRDFDNWRVERVQ